MFFCMAWFGCKVNAALHVSEKERLEENGCGWKIGVFSRRVIFRIFILVFGSITVKPYSIHFKFKKRFLTEQCSRGPRLLVLYRG